MKRTRKNIQFIIHELKRELKKIYGKRLEAVILDGSYAGGEATDNCDIDVLVVVEDVENPFIESNRFADVVWRLSLENDIVISAMAVDSQKFEKSGLPAFTLAREEE